MGLKVLLIGALSLTGCDDTLHDDRDPATRSTSMTEPLMPAGDTDTIQLADNILAPAVADLARRTGADKHEILVRRAMPVVWNDGAAGCPQPGVAYTQALVPGYWALLEYDGRYYSYHAAGRNVFRLCKSARVGPDDAPPHGRYDDTV